MNYRKQKIETIRRIILVLTYFLTIHISKIDKVSFKFLQDTETDLKKRLSEAKGSDRYMHERYISANDLAHTGTTRQPTADLQIMENFERPSKIYKKLKRGEI